MEIFNPLDKRNLGISIAGKGRYNQQISAWDTIHAGRDWAKKLQQGKPEEEIAKQIIDFLQ
jgi:hypothetical protein